jgi:hypothetical protein
VLSEIELRELESTLLPALERHHLRLLAHGLRTLQAIAGRREGPLPDRWAIEAWAQEQPVIAADADFRVAFVEQLVGAARQLETIAAGQGVQPMALDLPDLAHWSTAQADNRLSAGTAAAVPPPG